MRMKVVVCVLALLCTANAVAYEAGDIFVRVGAVGVMPNESSDGIAIPALSIAPIAGTEVEIGNETQLGLTLNYMFSPTLGLDLLAATPFKHSLTANLDGFQAGLSVPAGETHHLPPTLSLVYYPMGNSSSAFQPYIGAGLNYTIMFDTKVSGELEALTGTLAGAAGPVPLELDLDNSVGLGLLVGADFALDDKWHINASVRWIDINTDATFTSALGDTITVGNVEIDPLVWQLNVGYTF